MRVDNLDVEVVRHRLALGGYVAFVLPNAIVDKSSFFDAVRAALPLNPPLLGSHGWDALSDSLWQGLYELPGRRVAIFWSNTQAMARGASSDFKMALDVLADVAMSLGDPRLTNGNPKEVTVVVQ